MNTNTPAITPVFAAWTARKIFLKLHPGEDEWFDLIWKACLEHREKTDEAPGAVLPPALGVLPRDNAMTQQLAKDFAVMASTFLIQSPMARSELLNRLKDACSKHGHAKPVQNWVTQMAQELLGENYCEADLNQKTPESGVAADYLVWDISSEDVMSSEPKECPADTMREYWNKRMKYDLFINLETVFTPKTSKDKEIEIDKSDFRLLVALLLHKGRALDPIKLYLMGWEMASLSSGLAESDILANYLKGAISRIRTKFNGTIPNFKIPDKREYNGYVIKGRFDACVILSAKEVGLYLKL